MLTLMLVHCVAAAIAQSGGGSHKNREQAKKDTASNQLKDFMQLASDANMYFKFPSGYGYKEIKIADDDDYSSDYAMEIPGKEFEIWFQVKSQKGDYAAYERLRNDKANRLESPDSLYIKLAQAQARSLNEDEHFFVRNIASDVLSRFSANAGKSYLLSLADLPETKHYKYALLLALEKDHIGTALIICFTNTKNPEFFKNVNRISNFIKFRRNPKDANSQ